MDSLLLLLAQPGGSSLHTSEAFTKGKGSTIRCVALALTCPRSPVEFSSVSLLVLLLERWMVWKRSLKGKVSLPAALAQGPLDRSRLPGGACFHCQLCLALMAPADCPLPNFCRSLHVFSCVLPQGNLALQTNPLVIM